MGAFQDWDPGVVALRTERPDLADWAEMVMAELWSGPRTGRFDVPMIERQLARTGTPKP